MIAQSCIRVIVRKSPAGLFRSDHNQSRSQAPDHRPDPDNSRPICSALWTLQDRCTAVRPLSQPQPEIQNMSDQRLPFPSPSLKLHRLFEFICRNLVPFPYVRGDDAILADARFAVVKADHGTFRANVAVDAPLPEPVRSEIVGHATDGRGVEAGRDSGVRSAP